MEYVRGKLKKSDGSEIPFIQNVQDSHRRILLCLHGFAGDKDSSVIAALMEYFDEKAVGIIAFDWPAHGESNKPDSSLTVEDCLGDLDFVVKWIEQTFDVPIACFATSFGGFLATLYRNQNPEAFLCLILRSPALRMKEVFRNLISDDEYSIIEQGKEIIVGFDRKMSIGWGFYESLCANEAYSVVPPFPQNVFIIQGDQDQVVNPIDTITYAKKHGIRIAVFEGTDHVYKKPGEKERIIEVTARFLLERSGDH